MQHLMNTYGRQPIAFSRGEGSWLWDLQGKRYLDCLCSIAVSGIGHAHPRLTAAIQEQAGRLIHISNLYRIPEQELLASRLCTLADMEKVFFCNSGCEANEAAIKIARLHGHHKGIEAPAIIVMEKAFHGRTIATLSATGSRKVQAGFEPLLSGFVRVPYNDLPALDQVAALNPNVVAVLVEPVQGEGGINVPDDGYLAHLRRVCDAKGWLLMLDEVQSGMARTGKWFAYQHTAIKPDVVTLAKGLANGFPIGACLATTEASKGMTVGTHGTTFGGNPLAMAVGNAVLDIMTDPEFLDHVRKNAILLKQRLAELKDRYASVIAEVRGEGLLIGLRMIPQASEMVDELRAEKMLAVGAGDNVVRLLPPLIIGEEEISEAVARIDRACARLAETHARTAKVAS